MFEFKEGMRLPNGNLEVIVSNHYTGEIISRDPGHNQLQDWTKHSLAYQAAGRPFCTWGNHGEEITDVSAVTIDHYEDGSNTNKVVTSPWIYSSSLNGLVQKRDMITENILEADVPIGSPIYPFFPTKMRFGTGGLNTDLEPKDDIGTDATKLFKADETCPFIVMDRARTTQHITLADASSNTTNKVTYSVKLPGGLESYPYNGKIISEAGLFCDASLNIGDDYNMRTGMMLSYRTFSGIVKDESIDVTFNWSWRF